MVRSYEIWQGPNCVTVWEAATAQLALIEYLRGQSVPDQEIVRLSPDEVSWRGATYRAVVARPTPVPHR
jgi:hypothetical protein